MRPSLILCRRGGVGLQGSRRDLLCPGRPARCPSCSFTAPTNPSRSPSSCVYGDPHRRWNWVDDTSQIPSQLWDDRLCRAWAVGASSLPLADVACRVLGPTWCRRGHDEVLSLHPWSSPLPSASGRCWATLWDPHPTL
jgi:hypothetical protein